MEPLILPLVFYKVFIDGYKHGGASFNLIFNSIINNNFSIWCFERSFPIDQTLNICFPSTCFKIMFYPKIVTKSSTSLLRTYWKALVGCNTCIVRYKCYSLMVYCCFTCSCRFHIITVSQCYSYNFTRCWLAIVYI